MANFAFNPCCKGMATHHPRRAIVMTVMPALVVETKPILYEGDSCPWCEEVIEFTSEESEIKKLRGENDYLKKMNYALSLDLDNTVVENPNNKERE